MKIVGKVIFGLSFLASCMLFLCFWKEWIDFMSPFYPISLLALAVIDFAAIVLIEGGNIKEEAEQQRKLERQKRRLEKEKERQLQNYKQDFFWAMEHDFSGTKEGDTKELIEWELKTGKNDCHNEK